MQKIIPYLWFDNQSEEAVNYYTGLFKDSKILQVTHYGENAPMPAGTVLTISFQLKGQEFVALNGGPVFKFSEAISLFVDCDDQEEADFLWAELTREGEESMCGWLKDKYGVSWQIIPHGLLDLVFGTDPVRAARATQCMYTMKKIDLQKVRQAYEQD